MAAPGGYAELVPERLESVRRRIAESAKRAGRDPASIELVAVTKFHTIEAAQVAYSCGLRRFGENRIQEAEAKYATFFPERPDARFDLLGHLQGNKVAKALGLFSRIHSVDSSNLLESMLSRSLALAAPVEFLFEVNTAEASKSGFSSSAALFEACELIAQAQSRGLPRIIPRGLMTMAPLTDDQTAIRASFQRLRETREAIATRFGFEDFGVLSMGMSGDFELAIEEGATVVRIGTALFGERHQ